MVLIVEHRETIPTAAAPELPRRSTEQALRHMHWYFIPADASPLLQRRPFPLVSHRTAQEAP
jgi:hypothetical protein